MRYVVWSDSACDAWSERARSERACDVWSERARSDRACDATFNLFMEACFYLASCPDGVAVFAVTASQNIEPCVV